jgi:outer membrane protein with beta-barrel domain
MKQLIKKCTVTIITIAISLGCFAQEEEPVNTEELQKTILETVDKAMTYASKQVDAALKQAMKEMEEAQKELEQKQEDIDKKKEEATSEDEREKLEKEMVGVKEAMEEMEKAQKEIEKALEKAEQAIEETEIESSIRNESTEDGDTTRLKIKGKEILIFDDKDYESTAVEETNEDKEDDEDDEHENKHWAGLELGLAGYVTPSYTLNPPGGYDFLELDYSRSLNFNLNFWEQDINIVKEYVRLVTGLGFEFSSYSFKNNVNLLPNNPEVAAFTDTIITYQKNKLKTSWITLPLMLGFSTNKDRKKAFHLAAGAVVGYKIGSKLKQKYELDGQKYMPKVKSQYNLLPYRYGLRASIGYGNLNVYATYALSSMFEKNEGPELHPFTLGVRLLLL